jgi:hypothetical protein
MSNLNFLILRISFGGYINVTRLDGKNTNGILGSLKTRGKVALESGSVVVKI